jgi:hypothetical protein
MLNLQGTLDNDFIIGHPALKESKLLASKLLTDSQLRQKMSQKSLRESLNFTNQNIESKLMMSPDRVSSIVNEPSIISEGIEDLPSDRHENMRKMVPVLQHTSDPKTFLNDLIQMIFDRNLPRLKAALYTLEDPEWLDQKDLRGFTPLILTTKLAYTDQDAYYQILVSLLEAGANPRAKDTDGWTALEEAISHSNVKFCSLLFDYVSAYKLRNLADHQLSIIADLKKLQDYEVHIKWEFDSSIIPLVSKLGPSDTFKIWKIGDQIRLDSTIAGYKNLSTKRRPMCVA